MIQRELAKQSGHHVWKIKNEVGEREGNEIKDGQFGRREGRLNQMKEKCGREMWGDGWGTFLGCDPPPD